MPSSRRIQVVAGWSSMIRNMVESCDPTEGVFIGTHTAGGAVARVGETDPAWPHRNNEVERMKFIGSAVALVGASIVSWQSVAIYYLISGRVQAGEDQPPLPVAAGLLIFGAFLLVMGYVAAKRAGKNHR